MMIYKQFFPQTTTFSGSTKKLFLLFMTYKNQAFVTIQMEKLYTSSRKAQLEDVSQPFCYDGLLSLSPKQLLTLSRPVAQLYGQVRTDRNQYFVIDCSLSHPAGHKPFTCSHSVLR